MEAPDTPFWNNVERFRSMGLDPLRWVAGCSVKVDDELVLLPGLARARPAFERMGVTVADRGAPAAVDFRGEPLSVERVTVRADDSGEPFDAERANPRFASALGRVERRAGDDPHLFAGEMVRAVAAIPAAAGRQGARGSFDRPLVLGSLEAHATAVRGAGFFAFDLLDPGRGTVEGRFLVKGDALEVTDATLDPADPVHAAGALCAALAPLTALGCHEELRAWPTVDAPSEGARASALSALREAATGSGVRVEDAPAPGTGSLYLGATVAARAAHDPPGRHQDVAVGMEVAITRPFGDLAPLLVRLMARSEAALEERAEKAGFPMPELDRLAGLSRDALTTPDLTAARAIAAHRPPAGEAFEAANHIAATVDLSLEGAVGLVRFARRRGLDLRIHALPLAHEGLSRFATAEFLTDNATANAPGAIAIVAYPTALAQVEEWLDTEGRQVTPVATVTGIGAGRVTAPDAIRQTVGAKRLLDGLSIP